MTQIEKSRNWNHQILDEQTGHSGAGGKSQVAKHT